MQTFQTCRCRVSPNWAKPYQSHIKAIPRMKCHSASLLESFTWEIFQLASLASSRRSYRSFRIFFRPLHEKTGRSCLPLAFLFPSFPHGIDKQLQLLQLWRTFSDKRFCCTLLGCLFSSGLYLTYKPASSCKPRLMQFLNQARTQRSTHFVAFWLINSSLIIWVSMGAIMPKRSKVHACSLPVAACPCLGAGTTQLAHHCAC